MILNHVLPQQQHENEAIVAGFIHLKMGGSTRRLFCAGQAWPSAVVRDALKEKSPCSLGPQWMCFCWRLQIKDMNLMERGNKNQYAQMGARAGWLKDLTLSPSLHPSGSWTHCSSSNQPKHPHEENGQPLWQLNSNIFCTNTCLPKASGRESDTATFPSSCRGPENRVGHSVASCRMLSTFPTSNKVMLACTM